jgi:hypothetical protein
MLDKATFGGTYAALVLAETLNELNDKSVTRKVSRSYHDFTYQLKCVAQIQDVKIYVHTLHLFYNERMDSINYDVILPERVKDYLMNCVKAAYRTTLLEGLKLKTTPETFNKYKWLIKKLENRTYRRD